MAVVLLQHGVVELFVVTVLSAKDKVLHAVSTTAPVGDAVRPGAPCSEHHSSWG